jgi:hypothetical protein
MPRRPRECLRLAVMGGNRQQQMKRQLPLLASNITHEPFRFDRALWQCIAVAEQREIERFTVDGEHVTRFVKRQSILSALRGKNNVHQYHLPIAIKLICATAAAFVVAMARQAPQLATDGGIQALAITQSA